MEDPLAQLEARVAALEDERAIRELLARFSFLEDARRFDDWVALWTEDGVYAMGAQRFVGHPQLAALMDGMPPDTLHTHAATLEVRVDGDWAEVRGYTVLHLGSGTVSTAANRWTLRRVNGRWLVAARVRGAVGAAAFTEVLSDDPLGP